MTATQNDLPHAEGADCLDRSKCVLPASSETLSSDGIRILSSKFSFNLPQTRKDSSVGLSPTVSPPAAILKAAWALTLQCFIVADVICFRHTEALSKAFGTKDHSMALYITRLDLSESVQSFIDRFAHAHDSNGTSEPTGFAIGVADGHSSLHQCNTATSLASHLRLPIELDAETDIEMVVSENGHGESAACIIFRESHTCHDAAASILGTFQYIYVQLAGASKNLLIQDVDLCPPADMLLIKEMTSMDPTPSTRCVHELIVEQCQSRPEDIAVCSSDGNLTYRELDNLSLRLAHHLVSLGVGPEVFVLSCFEKSTWAIVARLAILRAGGAYISIHASNPPAYLKSVISRTKTQILLTDPFYSSRFHATVPTVVQVSPEWIRSLPDNGSAVPCSTVTAGNACLVLFTSGSTGTPKGIIEHHEAYTTAIQNYARDFKMGTHTRFLQFDDYAFDISNMEFLVPLIVGGTCCVPSAMKTVPELVEQINVLQANTLFVTPTVAIRLEPSDVPGLKTMCVGGEPLPKDLIRKWEGSPTKLINTYGMGEAAIVCAYNDNVNSAAGAVIGRPSTGAIWLADPASPERLMPIGAVGEVMIEGPHLSRGYLDETAIRRTDAGFLSATPRWMFGLHPDRQSARIYRSGDLARRNRDGTITYLGRKDTILKLDGCRIDALEVEHQARTCLSKKDTIVIDLLGIINGQSDPSLAAFLYLEDHPLSTVQTPGSTPEFSDALVDPVAADKVAQVKARIVDSLPRYMVPTTYILMSHTPRTPSKKLDRKKIHHLGQKFYLSLLEERGKDGSYAERMQTLPISE